jgi:hypothetical protein
MSTGYVCESQEKIYELQIMHRKYAD